MKRIVGVYNFTKIDIRLPHVRVDEIARDEHKRREEGNGDAPRAAAPLREERFRIPNSLPIRP